MPLVIATDTSANLPGSIVERRGLIVAPLTYIVEGEERTCPDPDAFDAEGYYAALKAGAQVTTSLVNAERCRSYLEPVLAAGNDVVYLSMSSGVSGSYGSVRAACAELELAYPGRRAIAVDTLGASLGEGFLVLRAADLRDAGADAEQTAAAILRERLHMCQYFTVDDLLYLHRGGRLSVAQALLGTVLNIKPILTGDAEGRIGVCGKTRGRKASLKALADYYADKATDAEASTVGIAHAGCPEDAAYLAGLVRAARVPRDILTVNYEPVTGAHVGPGGIALFFVGREK